jgi:periplasmic divalent cation tolerance protein
MAALIYVTCPDAACAERIARALVEDRLAACANLLPGMRSIFRWQGRVESADELVLLLKTADAQAAPAMAAVRRLHPYQVPCIVVLPIVAGDPDFLAWIDDATGAAPPAI